MIINTPKPPYYAVIFTSILNEDPKDYEQEAEIVLNLANSQPGFLGIESARDVIGISVTYWDSLDSIQNWSQNSRHALAKKKGKMDFYKAYKTRISKVEKDY